MYPSHNVSHARINSATDGCHQLSYERAGGFHAPAESRLMQGYNNTKEEGYLSSTSEARPMSTSEVTVGDESLSSGTDPIMPYVMTYGHQTPQMYVQQAGAPAYQPLMYDQRYHNQHSYNFQPIQMLPPSPGFVNMVPRQVQAVSPQMSISQSQPLQPQNMVPPSPGYVNMVSRQVQAVSPMMNVSRSQPLQPQNVVNPINRQQCQTPTQYYASMPTYTAATPRMMNPVSYSGIQEANTDTQRVSPNVFSSTVSTPLPNYLSSPGYVNFCSPGYVNFGSPGYVNSYGYINTPLSSVPCTPNAYFTTSADVPPVFHLNNKNLRRSTIPEQISCSINPAPVPSELERTNRAPLPVSTACGHSPMNLQTTSTNTVPVHTSANNIEQSATVEREEDDDLWSGTCEYVECQDNGGSNLFVTWSGSKLELGKKLHDYKLEVRDVLTTNDENVCNVIFQSHPIARKAFTMQREIRLRMVPPRNSHRNWLRNPSPKFLVLFETMRRLPVKKGKAECHDLVGELLMSNCQEQKGCLIWADQLKGHRIRVASCDGNFMFPGGRVVQMKGVSQEGDGKTSLGWISYRCKHTRESFVIRRSGNLLSDYVYRG